MHAVLENVFLDELIGQCNYALAARDEMRVTLVQKYTGGPGQRFWQAAQSLLAAVANVSKILYPIARLSVRGAYLRGVLGPITATFDPASRHIRNDYEHFDERIEDVCWPNSVSHARVDYNFAPAGMFEGQFGATNCFRNYDAATESLTFMGNRIALPPMEAALNELRDSALTRQVTLQLQRIAEWRAVTLDKK